MRSVDILVLAVEELVHLGNLHVAHSLSLVSFSGLFRAMLERVGELEGNYTTTLVTNQHNGINVVESNVMGLCALSSRLVAEVGVLVLVKIVDVEASFTGDGGENSGRVGSPGDVTDRVTQIKGLDRALHAHDPKLDGPVSRATEESLGVIFVPLNGVDSEVVVLVGLGVLTGEGSVAEVDVTFFGTDQEQVLVGLVEIEAHTAGKTVEEDFLALVEHNLLLVNHELKLVDLLGLELVLHQVPVGDAAIG